MYFKGLKLLRLIWINLTTSKQCLSRSHAIINCMYTSGDHTCFKLTTQVPWNGRFTCKRLKALNLLHHNTAGLYVLCSSLHYSDRPYETAPPPPPITVLNSHPSSHSSKTFWRTYLFDCIYSITIENLHFNSFSVWWTQRAIGGNSQRKLELLLFVRSGWCDILAGNRMTLFSTGHWCSCKRLSGRRGGGCLCSRLNRVSLEKLMVQVVPTGYDYIGGSRNCLKEGGAAFHDYFCPPFGPERRDYSTKNNPFLLKFFDWGGRGLQP